MSALSYPIAVKSDFYKSTLVWAPKFQVEMLSLEKLLNEKACPRKPKAVNTPYQCTHPNYGKESTSRDILRSFLFHYPLYLLLRLLFCYYF